MGATFFKYVKTGSHSADAGTTLMAMSSLTSVDLPALAPETTYYWAVDEWTLTGAVYPSPIWSFTTIPSDVPARIDDPNLLGYWAFDEGAHRTALDSSGNNHHGTITKATWVDVEVGSALNMADIGYVDVPAEAWATIDTQMTIAFWAYGDPVKLPMSHTIFSAYVDPANNNSASQDGGRSPPPGKSGIGH